MIGSKIRLLTHAAFAALLAGCASPAMVARTNTFPDSRPAPPPAYSVNPSLYPDSGAAPTTIDGTHISCVPYARERSGVNIRGNAYTWWEKAAGLYARASTPTPGSVMVLGNYAGKYRGHVAVVRRLVSARELRIDHANWLDDGAIYVNDPVVDVSANNDWTQVKVWNIRSGSWGTRTYTVQGFIGPGPEAGVPSGPNGPSNALVSSNLPARRDDPIGRQIAASLAMPASYRPAGTAPIAAAGLPTDNDLLNDNSGEQ